MEQAQADKRDDFKRLVEDLEERIYKLKHFDIDDQVNAHFDDLESEVILSVQSAIQHLNHVQALLLDKISAQRASILNRETEPLRSYRSDESLQQDIESLSREIREFGEKCRARSSDGLKVDLATMLFKHKARIFQERASNIRTELKKQAFKGRFMTFKKNDWFFMDDGLVGNLEPCEIDINDAPIETQVTFTKKAELKNKSHSYTPLFQSNGSLIVASRNAVQILDKNSNKLEHLLNVPTRRVRCMLELPGGFLAAGGEHGEILIVDVASAGVVKISQAHSGRVSELLLLPNNNSLLSFSSKDESMKTWRIGLNFEMTLLTTIVLVNDVIRIAAMNDSIVTCHNADAQFCIQFWDSNDGRLLKEVQKVSDLVNCVCLLPSDRIAIYTVKDGIEVLNIHDASVYHSIKVNEDVKYMIHVPSGHLVAGTGKELRLYDPNTGQIVKTNESVRHDFILKLSISNDGKCIYVSTNSHADYVWALSFS